MRHMAHRLARYSLVAGIALFAAPRVNAATIGVPENLGPWGLIPVRSDIDTCPVPVAD
jgi:hypothetical protein